MGLKNLSGLQMRRAAVSIASNSAEGAERIGILTPAQAQPLHAPRPHQIPQDLELESSDCTSVA